QFENALGVAASISLDFALRPLQNIQEPILPRAMTMPGERSILNLYGPDVDPNFWTTYSPHPGLPGKLEASISNVVRPRDIQQLPLEGNNIYSILLAEPGVAASNSTTRSLGVSANGMRPSSSSFLLDGIDTNFFLITGPLFAVSPESVQEYRFSTNNFSAEYGGTAGYIANAVSRPGTGAWHAQAFFALQNEKLNANGYQDNASTYSRRPSREIRPGIFAGGPIKRERLFLGVSTEYFRTRDRQQPIFVNLPNTELFDLAGCKFVSSIACRLLGGYALPKPTPDDPYVARVRFEVPVALDRWLYSGRLDYTSSNDRVHGMFRVAGSHIEQPDFIWSPYPDFVS